MRALLWIIAIFAVAVGVAMLADANNGYVLVVFPPWRAQISLNLLIVLLLFGFFAVYFTTRIISRAVDLPGRVGMFRARRQQDKAFRSMRDAVEALFEGRFGEALKLAKVAHASGGGSQVAALVAARAAHAMHDEPRYREWMGRAAESGEGQVAGLLTSAELAIESGDLVEAERALQSLGEGQQKNVAALRLALDVARAQARWEDAGDLVARLVHSKGMSPEQARPVLREVRIGALRAAAGDPAKQLAVWRAFGKEDLADAALVHGAVRVLAASSQAAVARRAVERLLEANWDTALARDYVLCSGTGDEAVDALACAERWLAARPDDAGLLYSLGRQCMAAQIWGKAQTYLEQSLRIAPAADAHLALGELFEQLGRPADAAVQFRTAAQLGFAHPMGLPKRNEVVPVA